MARELDIILFGATGFTGKHAISLLVKFTNNPRLTWGVAGRSETKLKELLAQYEAQFATSLNHVPIIVANILEASSLNAMARRARIIINCCGPYRLLGEAVVKACVEEGTHHVDVSGEPQYMENMQKYHDQAKEKGIYIISACGLESIPSDLGMVFLEKKFNGTLNSVESYFRFWEENSLRGPVVNYGTWESAVYVMANAHELKGIRQKLFPRRLPNFKPKLPLKFYPHKSEVVEGWVLPFLATDRSVIRRSQRYFYENDSKRPIQIETYMVIKSFLYVIALAIFGGIFSLLVRFTYGRKLLLKYPEIFTAGAFSHESPSEEKIERSCFSVTLRGEGWKEILPDANHEFTTPPNKLMTVRVKGRNPGYGTTCMCLVLAAITVITEPDKMPPGGGVYPPGYAFAKTSLTDQLHNNGVCFEVL